ncbi:MAG: glycosyltransferase family 39 protein [Patescibacteria group bacterium]|nr:glycosyltransferase family 39 protein [Patescibacteria group bacterium]MCL5431562.1 glycosyltransferase family 39 protein [Patescibacteria group bacterium]
MKKYALLLTIVFLAALLRLWQLGVNPPSLDWDEASLGWNAYSILKTGSDEFGKPIPVSLRSFNDYKPAMYAYAAIPSIAVFGLNEFSVRLPSAIAGILTVLVTFFLVKELTDNDLLSYCVAGLLAVSPWSIQFSRVAFEANLALFFFVLGAYFLIKFLHRPNILFSIAYCLSFVASIYSYHSPRVVVPVLLVAIVLIYRRIFLSHWRLFLVSYFLFLALLYPLARNTVHTGSLEARYQTVAAKLDPMVITGNYLRHFNFDFLFLTGDDQDRHHAPDMGLLYLWEFPFLLAGLYFLVKDRPKFLPFLAIWFFAAPTASSLANDAPHAVRSLLFLPTWQIITAYGLVNLLRGRPLLVCLISLVIFANVFYFLHQYFVHLPVEDAPAWQYGYKQMVKNVLAVEKNYDRIYVTGAYDQPYIYFLFYGRIAPTIKNDGYFYTGFDKYQFSTTDVVDLKGLYVLAPKDNPPAGYKLNVLETVNFPAGAPAFEIGTIQKS